MNTLVIVGVASHLTLLETCPGELRHLPIAIEAKFRRPLYMPSTMKASFCRSGPTLLLNVTNAENESDLHVEVTAQRMA